MSISEIRSASAQSPPQIGRRPSPAGFEQWGLLSNPGIQTASGGPRFEVDLYRFVQLKVTFDAAGPGTKLRLLKEQRFFPDGRDQRIEKSLAALHARQLFVQPFQEWRWAIEDIEAEEQE